MYRPYSSSLAASRPFMDVESQLRGLTQDYVTSFNTGNYDLVAAMFAADGVLMAPRHDTANGRKLVERLLRDFGEEGYSDMRVETERIENAGDMAMELGRYSMTIRQANGTLVGERGKYVRVWRRLGAWLILADCWSRNPPVT
jgi:ketosteroid isomerase-like protein